MYRQDPPQQRGYANNVRFDFGPRRQFQHNHRSNFPNVNNSSFGIPTKEYWCETCDRDFRSPQLLESHVQQHEKCNIDGCQFVAHPKVITKHIQMQHSSGLYNKIANLTNPEAINIWREERKKKYPTKCNIEKKLAENKEKIERGEKYCLQQNKNQKRKLFEADKKDLKWIHERNHPNKLQKNKSIQKKCKKQLKITKKNYITVENRPILKPFAGIQTLIFNSDSDEEVAVPESDFLIDDDEYEINGTVKRNETANKTVLCGVLTNLIYDYGSSDEDNNLSQIETPIIKNEAQVNDLVQEKPINSKNNDISDEDSGPDEMKTLTCRQNVDDVALKVDTIKTKNMTPPRLKGHLTRKWRSKPLSTLLQKLLYKEVRQERNIVLQCIRHIINNHYFENK